MTTGPIALQNTSGYRTYSHFVLLIVTTPVKVQLISLVVNGPSVTWSDDDSVTLYDKSLQDPLVTSQLALTVVHLSVNCWYSYRNSIVSTCIYPINIYKLIYTLSQCHDSDSTYMSEHHFTNL